LSNTLPQILQDSLDNSVPILEEFEPDEYRDDKSVGKSGLESSNLRRREMERAFILALPSATKEKGFCHEKERKKPKIRLLHKISLSPSGTLFFQNNPK